MSDPYIGQIVAVGFNFAPKGWALCDGSLLQIAANTALFSLLGTQFGGDGVKTFGVPDLRGRIVVGTGQGPGLSNYVQGKPGGVETVTLSNTQDGAHTHGVVASGFTTDPTAYVADPASDLLPGAPGGTNYYAPLSAGTQTTLAPSTLTPATGGQPHDNRQPYQTLNYIIALTGAYPQRP